MANILPPSALATLPYAFEQRGVEEMDAGNFERAVAAFTMGLRLCPDQEWTRSCLVPGTIVLEVFRGMTDWNPGQWGGMTKNDRVNFEIGEVRLRKTGCMA